MAKLYQNLHIDGEDFNVQNPKKKDSKFWNEGKFKNFIEPHLPEFCTDMTFVEMGCNAGLFLKMAKDKGFRIAVGVEKNKTPVKEGKRYRDILGYDYKILKRSLGGKFGEKGSFDIDEIPTADFTVMSTFHYYIDINTWMKYIDALKNKTRFVIIVSRHTKQRHWRALSDLEPVRRYFRDWKEVSYIEPISKKGDPAPRNLWSICFESNLKRVSIDTIKRQKSEKNRMYNAVRELSDEVAENKDISVFDTEYYKRWVERKSGKWHPKLIKKFVSNKFELLKSIKENGQIDPLIVQEDMKLSDGGHRLAILESLGNKSVIVRVV